MAINHYCEKSLLSLPLLDNPSIAPRFLKKKQELHLYLTLLIAWTVPPRLKETCKTRENGARNCLHSLRVLVRLYSMTRG